MKLQSVMLRYDLFVHVGRGQTPAIRFRGGEWIIPTGDHSPEGLFAAFLKQLKDAAWTELSGVSLKEFMTLGSTPEEAEGEWYRRNALSRSLLIFFGVEIYDALLSTEEVLS